MREEEAAAYPWRLWRRVKESRQLFSIRPCCTPRAAQQGGEGGHGRRLAHLPASGVNEMP